MNKKNKIALILILLLGLGIFGWEFRDLSLPLVYAELRILRWRWVFIAVACMLIHWSIEAKILQGLLKKKKSRFSFVSALRIPLIEHLFNAITPFSGGGQPAQLIALMKSGVDAGVGSSVLLMKFVVYQAMIVMNFLMCLILGFHLLSAQLTQLSTFVILGFGINLVVIISLLTIMFNFPVASKLAQLIIKPILWFKKPEDRERFKAHIQEKVTLFYEESLYIRGRKDLLLRTFVLTGIQLVFYFVVPYFILLSLGVAKVSVFTIIILHTFIILIVSLFPIPGGSGGAEYSFTLLFGSFVISPEKLVIALILWRLVTHYTGIFLGVCALGVKPAGFIAIKENTERA